MQLYKNTLPYVIYDDFYQLTQINEYVISNEIIEEQINKISALIQNAKEIKKEKKENVIQYNQIKLNIENQNLILKQMNNEIDDLNQEEKKLNFEIKEMKNKILKEKIKIDNNKNIVISLKKQNINLLKETKKTHSKFSTSNSKNYISEICEIKKGINHYKKKIKISNITLSQLKTENEKLKKLNNENLQLSQNTSIIITNSMKQNSDDERIKNLQESLQNSKLIEKELENQLLIYQNKLNELQNENYNEQIEFGIDSNNPYFSSNEENNPIETSKLTSIQFNQFTYILFKNFEAKNINLENNNSKFIDELINNANKEEEQIEEVDINSESFISIVNKFCNSISDVLNCGNEYNIKMLKIFIGALLFNSGGSIVKLSEYFTVLFSYTKIYQKELENKLIERINRKYKDNAELLLKLINEQNINGNDYISLLEVKDIIDNNNIELKDKYIEFIFYIMKKFDDKNAKLSDLKISNYGKILFPNSNDSNKDKISSKQLDIEKEEKLKEDKENNNNENMKKLLILV